MLTVGTNTTNIGCQVDDDHILSIETIAKRIVKQLLDGITIRQVIIFNMRNKNIGRTALF